VFTELRVWLAKHLNSLLERVSILHTSYREGKAENARITEERKAKERAKEEELHTLYAKCKCDTSMYSQSPCLSVPILNVRHTHGFWNASAEEYPKGWPQLAAFLNSKDNFAIFRRFRLIHCRVLLHLQAEITILEQKLINLDLSDSLEGSSTKWRLLTAEFQDGWDPAQQNILRQLQQKLSIYGENAWWNVRLTEC
jgi:hypothetical protein